MTCLPVTHHAVMVLHVASHRSFRLFYRVLGACLGIGTAACGGVAHDLHAATELYRDARYEAVQAWIAQLRNEYADMSRTQRAEFHYLSGMTAYRLAQPDEALHELALAAHAARERPCPPCALGNEQLALLYRTLEELMANRFKAAR